MSTQRRDPGPGGGDILFLMFVLPVALFIGFLIISSFTSVGEFIADALSGLPL